MSASSNLIKALCILSLLLVSASAGLLDELQRERERMFEENRERIEKIIGKREGEDEGENHQAGLGLLPRLPGFDALFPPGRPSESQSMHTTDPEEGSDEQGNSESMSSSEQKEIKQENNQGEQDQRLSNEPQPQQQQQQIPEQQVPVQQQQQQQQQQIPEQQVPVQQPQQQQQQQKIPEQQVPVQQPQLPQQPAPQGEVAPTDFPGEWEVVSQNSGVSAKHLQLMPSGKFVMFDATSLGKSNIQLAPGNCRIIPKVGGQDCWAHSVEYDPVSNTVRTLKVTTDPWCSSGGLAPDGTLVGTGGWADGERTQRYFTPCDNCDWRESGVNLTEPRWYGTQILMPDGRFVVIGGRRAFSYEFLAPEGRPSPGAVRLPFLWDTTDIHENNLYPFVHIAPDGNLFILANNKAILLDVNANKIVRRYPDLPGGARNYPGSGSSAILPIDLRQQNTNLDIEVLVCGGGQPLAFGKAEKEGIFLPALDTCGRIKVLDPKAQWEMEKMPSARVMGDMLNLPNGEILILNGAKKGASGWQFADEANLNPLLYTPNKPNSQRFRELRPSQIPRVYHSTSAVLPDARILVAGSNTNPSYLYANVKFPTELRVEKFSPPYFDPRLLLLRPEITTLSAKKVGYGGVIALGFQVKAPEVLLQQNVMVTLYQPPFTTHGYSMNQRLLNLEVSTFQPQAAGSCNLQVKAPASNRLAPPGYYLLFVNYKGVPSAAQWIQLQ